MLDVRELDSARAGDYDDVPTYLVSFLPFNVKWDAVLNEIGPDHSLYKLLAVTAAPTTPTSR